MRLNIVGKHLAPDPPYRCDFHALPTEAIPSVLWSLWLKSQKYFWTDDTEALQARNMLAEFGIGLLMPCGNELGYKIDRLARILDSAMFGRTYIATGELDDNQLPIVTPALSDSVSPTGALDPSMFQHSLIQRLLVQNLVDGTPTFYTLESRNFRQQLDDIKAILAEFEAGQIDYTTLITQIIALLA